MHKHGVQTRPVDKTTHTQTTEMLNKQQDQQLNLEVARSLTLFNNYFHLHLPCVSKRFRRVPPQRPSASPSVDTVALPLG